MTTATLTPALKLLLDEIFTRTYMSAATYVFESQPFEVPEDAELMARMRAIKDQDRDHATLIATLLRAHDEVPEAGVFPYWHRDLNYLTVPYMAGFVVEALGKDLVVIDQALAAAGDALPTVTQALTVMRTERAAWLDELAPMTIAGQAREDAAYAAASAAVRETREARVAAEKAAEAARKEAERKAKAEAKANADAEAAAQAAAAAPAPTTPDPTIGMPDPNEEGISSKEKAKRTMMIKRAKKKWEEEQAAAAASAPAPAAASTAAPTKSLDDVLAAMPDPDEPGISAKEKAKRTVMRNRAKKAWEAENG